MSVKSYAFYLPQFHPIPENDKWWGPGFTEWNNVTRGVPVFENHYQPHVPGELGYYDLRLPEVREQQAKLASEYRIDGFIYYHYWFNGKRLLERPFNEVLKDGPDFPFALTWANEDWRSNWDGRSGEVLMAQSYSEEDDRAHIKWLIEAFKDDRYIRIDGKPLFSIYRSHLLPNPARTTEIWRDEARKAGIGELYLCRVESFYDERDNPTEYGFDASIEFAPDWDLLHSPDPDRLPYRVFDYEIYSNQMLSKPEPDWTRYSTVTPQWDNCARRPEDGLVLDSSLPQYYENWVYETLKRDATRFGSDEQVLFVNAWNEWGEGCHLEPDQKWGRGYLEAHRNAVERFVGNVPSAPSKKSGFRIIGGETKPPDPDPIQPVTPISVGIEPQPVAALPTVKVEEVKSDKPFLSAIILHSDSRLSIEDSIETVYKTCESACDVEVTVVDCVVHEQTPEFDRDVNYVTSGTDYSVTAAWTNGLEYVHGDYVLFMTSDIGLRPGWLDAAISTLKQDPRAGAVSPTLRKGSKSLVSQPPASGAGVCLLARFGHVESGAPLSAKHARKSIAYWNTEPRKAKV